jgi:hypothetical protein
LAPVQPDPTSLVLITAAVAPAPLVSVPVFPAAVALRRAARLAAPAEEAPA